MNELTPDYLKYLEKNAREAARLNILDEFVSTLRSVDVLKDFINYLGRYPKEENIVLLNMINDLVNKSHAEIDVAPTRA